MIKLKKNLDEIKVSFNKLYSLMNVTFYIKIDILLYKIVFIKVLKEELPYLWYESLKKEAG